MPSKRWQRWMCRVTELMLAYSELNAQSDCDNVGQLLVVGSFIYIKGLFWKVWLYAAETRGEVSVLGWHHFDGFLGIIVISHSESNNKSDEIDIGYSLQVLFMNSGTMLTKNQVLDQQKSLEALVEYSDLLCCISWSINSHLIAFDERIHSGSD